MRDWRLDYKAVKEAKAQMTCSICGETGHKAKDCPEDQYLNRGLSSNQLDP